MTIPSDADLIAWCERLVRGAAPTIGRTPSGGFDTGGTALITLSVSDLLYVRAIAARLRDAGEPDGLGVSQGEAGAAALRDEARAKARYRRQNAGKSEPGPGWEGER